MKAFYRPAGIRLALLILGATPIGGRLDGQELRIAVTQSAARPAVGALATLTDPGGRIVASAITDELGRGRLSAPAGEFALRVVRLGFVDTSLAVTVGSATDSIVVRAPDRRPDFPTILTALPVACSAPGVPAALAVPWSHAKAAFGVIAAGEALEAATLSITTFARELSTASKRETDEAATILATGNVPPNVSLAAERDGYLRRTDSLDWLAPDVRTFASAEFEAGHCFGWTTGAGDRDGLLGLEFAPSSGTPARIAGTIWFDPPTRELRVIDYRFTGLPADWHAERIGGSIELHRSDRGLWVTRFWYQRTPRIRLASGGGKDRLLGYHEVGAEVTAVEPAVDTTDRIATARAIARNRAVARGRFARMLGTVTDSGGAVVADAEIALLGSELETKTDDKGSFAMSGLPLGLQIVRVRKIGFKAKFVPLRLVAGQEWTGAIKVARLPMTLEEIVVVGKYGKPAKYASTGKYDGFYRRRAAKSGKFLTRDEIDKMNTGRVADLIKGVPGVITSFNPVAGRDGVEFRSCPTNVSVWVDGQRLSGEPGELLPLITARDVETLEIYQRESQLPPEFQDGSCAAIVMWTR